MSRMNPLTNQLEQVYLQMIVNYLPKNDLFKFMNVNKKCALSVKRAVTNQIPVEPTVSMRKGNISAYKMYDHLQTLKVYSYEDLFNVYVDTLTENRLESKFNKRKREKNPDIFVSLTNKDEIANIQYQVKYMEGTVEEKIGKLYELFESAQSKIDQNGITMEMVIEEYKKYFPKLTKIEIWLKPLRGCEYQMMKDFINLYSKKNKWNRQLWFWNKTTQRLRDRIEQTRLVRLEPNVQLYSEQERNEEGDDGFRRQPIQIDGHEAILYEFDWDDEDEISETESDTETEEEMSEEEELSEDSEQIRLIRMEAGSNEGRDDYRIPQGISIIPNHGFEMSLVEDVVLPSGVKCLGDYCFKNCRDLTRIVIPHNVEYLGKECFMKCYELKEIHFDVNGLLYDIREGCFKGCKSLEEFIMPHRVEQIGIECFSGCENLRRVVLNNVKCIGKWTFKNCSNLFNIELPDGIKVWGDPFDNTPYKILKLMERLKNQGKYLLTN